MYFSDGPVGPRQGKSTGLPIPMAVAATFDPRLANLHAQVAAGEARAKGNDVIFAPTVNIMRTPLGGRTFESYGEDPFLMSRLGVGWVQGVQSKGVIANVKHFAANNQEGASPAANAGGPGQPVGPPAAQGDRLTVDTVVDERTLREIYLPHFEAAVKRGHAGSIMCSYNRLNGQYACENKHLLQEVLDEWGFKGFVLADYGAAKNTADSLNNGLDFDPWPGFAYSPTAVNAALASGGSSMARVDDHVQRILRTLFAYGFFDRRRLQGRRRADRQAGQSPGGAADRGVGDHPAAQRGGALPLDAGQAEVDRPDRQAAPTRSRRAVARATSCRSRSSRRARRSPTARATACRFATTTAATPRGRRPWPGPPTWRSWSPPTTRARARTARASRSSARRSTATRTR